VKYWSVSKLDFFATVDSVRVMMHYFFKRIIKQGFKVHNRKFHDDVKRNKVYNRIFNGLLESENLKINEFTIHSNHKLNESDDETYLRRILCKQVMLIVSELHYLHSAHDFRVQTEMESNCTWKLHY